jgi:hypothetical protein
MIGRHKDSVRLVLVGGGIGSFRPSAYLINVGQGRRYRRLGDEIPLVIAFSDPHTVWSLPVSSH